MDDEVADFVIGMLASDRIQETAKNAAPTANNPLVATKMQLMLPILTPECVP